MEVMVLAWNLGWLLGKFNQVYYNSLKRNFLHSAIQRSSQGVFEPVRRHPSFRARRPIALEKHAKIFLDWTYLACFPSYHFTRTCGKTSTLEAEVIRRRELALRRSCSTFEANPKPFVVFCEDCDSICDSDCLFLFCQSYLIGFDWLEKVVWHLKKSLVRGQCHVDWLSASWVFISNKENMLHQNNPLLISLKLLHSDEREPTWKLWMGRLTWLPISDWGVVFVC